MSTHYVEVWNITAVSTEVYEVKMSGEDHPGERECGKHFENLSCLDRDLSQRNDPSLLLSSFLRVLM